MTVTEDKPVTATETYVTEEVTEMVVDSQQQVEEVMTETKVRPEGPQEIEQVLEERIVETVDVETTFQPIEADQEQPSEISEASIITEAPQPADLVETVEITESLLPAVVKPLKPIMRVQDGQSMMLQCQFDMKEITEAVWLHGDQLVVENEDITIYQDETGLCELRVAEVFPEDAGDYACRLETGYGVVETRSQITVEGEY